MPRLSVPIAAVRTLQISRVAPKTPSTPKPQGQKRRKTSGKSVRLRASKIPNNQNLPLRKLLKAQKTTHWMPKKL
ncbi:hypothetical protein TNCV_1127941 [Trichonephila clavipes]|nr:hypothetical protein TNCV_1127941 [Trichonephila clavipes]